MKALENAVALVTGAARGQGRSHALALAREGATVVACDIAEQIDSVPYAMSDSGDLEETVALVEAAGGRCIGARVDIRSTEQVDALVAETIREFGRIDVLVANAAVCGYRTFGTITDEVWSDMLETNLSGTFRCMRAVLPGMTEQKSGRVIVISSDAGRSGAPNIAHYAATKWGVIGLAKSLALETAEDGITVNVICPTTTHTPMVTNEQNYRLFCPDLDAPSLEDALPRLGTLNPMKRPWMEPDEVSRAVLYFACDSGGYLSGTVLELSMGASARRV